VRSGSGDGIAKEMTVRLHTIFLLVIALAVAVPTHSNGAEQAQDFFSGVEDLPLAPGLDEVRDAGMIYDTPAGRIVHATAKGASQPGDVIGFYRATLPQLGWQIVGATRFQRETEILELKVTRIAGGVKLAVTLTPVER
jgi:hypothetical protein